MDLARLNDLGHQRGRPMEGLAYLEQLMTAAIDATLAAQNEAIAAKSLGLDTVYIGGIRNCPQQVAELLQLPLGVFAVFGMCVGYADKAKPASIKPRLPQAAVLHRQTYQLEVQAIAEYNNIVRQFYETQKMNVAGDWVEHSLERVATIEALNGRGRLKEILERMGFRLQHTSSA